MKVNRAIVICAVVIAAAALVPNRRSGAVVTPKPGRRRRRGSRACLPRRRRRPGGYIVRTSGCNDCHTPNFMAMGEKVPESQWLVGNPIGFRGPWGTTYPQNLRRFVQPFTAEQFVEVVRSATTARRCRGRSCTR